MGEGTKKDEAGRKKRRLNINLKKKKKKKKTAYQNIAGSMWT